MPWLTQEIPWTAWFWPAVLSVISCWLWRTTVRYSPEVKIGLLVYAGFYLLTTLIGGVFIGVTQGEVLLELEYGLDISPLVGVGNVSYWLMLFAPLILPMATFLCVRDAKLLDALLQHVIPRSETRISTTGYLSTFGFFAGYCLACLAWNGKLFAITTWQSSQSDYSGIIDVRYELTEQLGSAFFGIIYIALPTLSFIALHQAVATKLFVWKTLTVLSVLTVAFISLSVMHKSPCILYLAFISLALLDLNVIKMKTLLVAGLGLLTVITFLQSLMLENWQVSQSLTLIIFRMASSFPYFLSLYPDPLPHEGIETGLHLVGIGQPSQDSGLVLTYMYPDLKVKGNAAAPAHLRAYAQAGYLFAAVNLMVLCLPLKAAVMAHRVRQSPLAFAVYMGLLIQLYFVMQTSLREAIISCYGIFWVIVAVAAANMMSYSAKTPSTRQSTAPPPMPARRDDPHLARRSPRMPLASQVR